MPFCPNPECPYLKRIGKPAEYLEGVSHCSDCGSPLTEGPITSVEKDLIKKKRARKPLSDLQRRLIYTFLLLALARVFAHIPAPGINFHAFDAFTNQKGAYFVPSFGYRHSILALGLMPYVSAFIIVEIFSLFTKPLKLWKAEGYQGRRKLKRAALFLTLIVAILQGYGIATGLEKLSEGSFVISPGYEFRLLFILTLTASTYILIWIADQITKKGIGHGVSVIIFAFSLSALLPGLYNNLRKISAYSNLSSHSSFDYFFLAGLIAAVMILIIITIEKAHKRIDLKYEDGTDAFVPLKLTTAGLIPAYGAFFLIGLFPPLFFTNSELLNSITRALSPDKVSYYAVNSILIIFLYFLFTSSFYRPEKIIDSLQEKGALFNVPEGTAPENYMDRTLEILAGISAIYLCILIFIPVIAKLLGLPIFLSGLAFIETTAIGLDLTGELKIRNKKGTLVKIAEYHNVPEAGLCKSLLEQKGIPCHLQGYYYRALLYFFGPYIEISVLVPREMALEAGEVVRKYLNENVLVPSLAAKE